MKRNLILTIAVAVFMVATTVAQAADVTFSGQFRPRYNIDNDATNSTTPAHFFDTRVRLNAKANVNANTEVFLQFQSVGTWGAANVDAGGTASSVGTRESVGGGLGAGDAAEASDLLNDVGFHQAYLILKNLGGYGADLKIGRQEVVIDGHRLFGHTGWTQGGETKDAFRLMHSAGNHAFSYTFIQGDETDAIGNATKQDESVHVFYGQTQGIMGGALSGIFTVTDDDNGSAAWEDQDTWFTIGARQKGKAAGLDYRVEFYHQFGDGGTIANTCACGIVGADNSPGAQADRDAQLFGVRVGKTFKNNAGSPTITLWYDNLSGQDDDDGGGGDFGAFDVMYDTGHKFYGLMDAFLNRTGANTGFYGLQDIAVKTKFTPRPGWTAKMDWHHFRTQTNLSGGGDAGTTIAADATMGSTSMTDDLGTEVDLTLVHKYDANTKIAFGYSHFWTTTTFSTLNGGGGSLANNAGSDQNDDADWTYIQIDTKF